MGALEECLDLEARLGRHVQLVPELTALIGAYPFRERLRGLLMTVLHRSGRQAEALAAYREARRFLVEELGSEPGDELQQVHRQILEPVLAPSAAPAQVVAQVVAPPMPQPGPSPAAAHPWGVRLGTWWLPLLPLLSLGFLSWAAAGYGAIRLRSMVHGLIAGAYFALVTVAFVTTEANSSLYSKDVATLAIVLCWVGGTGQGLLLRYRVLELRASLSDPLVQLARERTTRRQSARQILVREPAVARDLRIGRPDLPREYDDGGLVDLNHVPEQVLTDVLGIAPEQAGRIVAERERTGGFWSIEEVVGRGLLPEATVRALAEILVVIR